MNITDVDDKIILRGRQQYLDMLEGSTIDASDYSIFTKLTRKYEERFMRDLRDLNVLEILMNSLASLNTVRTTPSSWNALWKSNSHT